LEEKYTQEETLQDKVVGLWSGDTAAPDLCLKGNLEVVRANGGKNLGGLWQKRLG
jgi:hypothetical protein